MADRPLPATAARGPLLEASDLVKTFRTRYGTVEAVKGVSIDIAAGEIVGFLGPNGAGKTTTIKMIAGLIRPDTGAVRVRGEDPHADPKALRLLGAVLEGNRNVYWRLTPEENIEYFGVLKGVPARQARRRGLELLERFGLGGRTRQPVMQFSRGMKQKVALAVALVHDPPLLLLDEPILGLDVEAAQTVKQLVRECAAEGRAILLTTHQLHVAEELSDRLAIIRQGETVALEPTQELIQRFSGDTYLIRIDGEIDGERRSQLKAMGAWLRDGVVGYLGPAEELYTVLDILRPLPVLKVVKDAADLTGVFLKLTREGADA